MAGPRIENHPGANPVLEPHPQSPYRSVIDKLAARDVPEKRADIDRIIGVVDSQMIANFHPFEISQYPGLKTPVTRISVNQVAKAYLGDKAPKDLIPNAEVQDPDRRKHIHVIHVSWNIGKNGHPVISSDMGYDRVMELMEQLSKNPKQDFEVHLVGLPYGMGGNVTKEWLRDNWRRPHAGYRKTVGAYVNSILSAYPEERKNTTWSIEGLSMGGTVVAQASQETGSRYERNSTRERRTKSILVNPAGAQELRDSEFAVPFRVRGRTFRISPDGLRVVGGFMKETIKAGQRNPMAAEIAAGQNNFREVTGPELLKQNGISTELPTTSDDFITFPGGGKLRVPLGLRANLLDVLNMVDGAAIYPDDGHTILIGNEDSTQPPSLQKLGNATLDQSTIRNIDAYHGVNYLRVRRWAQRLDRIDQNLQPAA